MKKYLLAIVSGLALTGCATLEPVYEKWNAQVAAFKRIVAPAASTSTTALAEAQEEPEYFFERISACYVNPKSPDVVEFHFLKTFYRKLFDGSIKEIKRPGMIGLGIEWGEELEEEKLAWAKPKKLPNGSYRLAFPGRKPMIITKSTKTDEDSNIYFSIKEVGGKKWMCGPSSY